MTTEHVPKSTAILLLSCPDQKGVVATIADFVYRHNGNILHADEHADEGSNLFLMRVEFDPADFDIDLADFARHFDPIAKRFDMTWRLAQSARRPRMAILVTITASPIFSIDTAVANSPAKFRSSFRIIPTTNPLRIFTVYRSRRFLW